MPYLKPERRAEMDAGDYASDPGDLNYQLTTIVTGYLGSTPRYKDFNEVLGVLEAVKLELYRRMVAPYEDQQREINGDVY